MNKKIHITPYDPLWPLIFEKEARHIQTHLECLAIYHVGSTSVFGMSAKPRIDIIAAIKKDQSCIENLGSVDILKK